MKIISSLSQASSKESLSNRPNYALRRIFVGLGLLATIAVGAKGHDMYVDKTTVDPNSVTAVADTAPNPTAGGKEMLESMLESNDPAKATTAANVNTTELGSEIARAVYAATGEKEREISANYEVQVTIEPDGDIASAEVIESN